MAGESSGELGVLKRSSGERTKTNGRAKLERAQREKISRAKIDFRFTRFILEVGTMNQKKKKKKKRESEKIGARGNIEMLVCIIVSYG